MCLDNISKRKLVENRENLSRPAEKWLRLPSGSLQLADLRMKEAFPLCLINSGGTSISD